MVRIRKIRNTQRMFVGKSYKCKCLHQSGNSLQVGGSCSILDRDRDRDRDRDFSLCHRVQIRMTLMTKSRVD